MWEGVMTIEEVEKYFDHKLPTTYRQFIANHNAEIDGDVYLYLIEDLIERNECYETKEYAPGYINIGNDCGGQAFILKLADDDPEVFIVGHGSMDPELKEFIYQSFSSWASSGFKYTA